MTRQRLLRHPHDALTVSRARTVVLIETETPERNRVWPLGKPGPQLIQRVGAERGEKRADIEGCGPARRAEPVGSRVQFAQHTMKDDARRLPQRAVDSAEIDRHEV